MKSEQRLRTLESPQGERARSDSELQPPRGGEPAKQAREATAVTELAEHREATFDSKETKIVWRTARGSQP